MIEFSQLEAALQAALPNHPNPSALNGLVVALESYCNCFSSAQDTQQRIAALTEIQTLLAALNHRTILVGDMQIAFYTERLIHRITVQSVELQQPPLLIPRPANRPLPPLLQNMHRLIGGLLASLVTLATIIGAWPIVGPSLTKALSQAPVVGGLFNEFSAEQPGEILIIIATFDRAEGTAATEPHTKIRRAIAKEIAALSIKNIRVEQSQIVLSNTDNQQDADAFGAHYNASLVIWGSYDSAQFSVRFLNRKQPDYSGASVSYDEKKRTELSALSNPDPYNTFIVSDLPAFTSFLSLYAVGQTFYIDERYQEARNVIERAVTLLPTTMAQESGGNGAFFLLGWIYGRVEKNQHAAKDNYDKAIALDPSDGSAYINRGAAYTSLGEYYRAVEDYDKAIALDLNNARAYVNRGAAYIGLGEYHRAVEDLDKATSLDPNLTLAYINRGAAYLYLGEFRHTIEESDKAFKLDPNNSLVYLNRGAAYVSLGEYHRAIEELDKAILLDPNDAMAYYNRGAAYAGLDNYRHAIEDLDKAISLDPNDATAYYKRGNTYSSLNEYRSAVENYDKAIALDPNHPLTYYNRAVAYANLSDYRHAIEDFNKAIVLDPNDATAYYNRGLAYNKLGEHRRAIQDYDKAIVLDPNYIDAYNNRGLTYKDLGDYRLAIEDYDKAIALNPNYAYAYYNRGLGHRLNNEKEAAIIDFKKFIELNDEPLLEQRANEQLTELGAMP